MNIIDMTKDKYEDWLDHSTKRQAMDRAYVNDSDKELEEERLRAMLPHLLPDGLETANHHFYLMEDDEGADVGFLWFGTIPNLPEGSVLLFDIVIKQSHRGQGYGRQLLEAGHRKMTEHGYNNILLSVLKNNPAHHLYRSLGYQVTSETDKHYEMILTL